MQTFFRWCWESKNRVTILSAKEYHNWKTKDDRNIYTFGERRNNVAINYVWRVWITRRSRNAGFIKEKERLLNRVSNSLFIPTWHFSLSPVSEQNGRCKLHRNNPSDLVCFDSTILSRVILSESHSSVIYASKSVEHSSNHLLSVSINLCYRILFSNNVATKENVKDSFDILYTLFLPSRLYSFMTCIALRFYQIQRNWYL